MSWKYVSSEPNLWLDTVVLCHAEVNPKTVGPKFITLWDGENTEYPEDRKTYFLVNSKKNILGQGTNKNSDRAFFSAKFFVNSHSEQVYCWYGTDKKTDHNLDEK